MGTSPVMTAPPVRACIIGSGPLVVSPRLLSIAHAAHLVVCADGGTETVTALGVRPDFIVGDFDSISQATLSKWRSAGVVIHQHPTAKDETDGELAVRCALEQGATDLDLLGMTGGRFDHTLGNVLLLAHPMLISVRAALHLENATIHLLRDGQTLHLHGQPGNLVSLLPISPHVHGITATGMLYPLTGESLALGPTRGVSNQLIAPVAHVRIEYGYLLVVHGQDQSAQPLP